MCPYSCSFSTCTSSEATNASPCIHQSLDRRSLPFSMKDPTLTVDLSAQPRQVCTFKRNAGLNTDCMARTNLIPVDTLPYELLVTIFRSAIYAMPRRKNPLPIIVIISHVSRRWRQVAIGEPQLWTDLVIIPDLRPAHISTYLERSKPCLLDVYFDLPRSPPTTHRVSSIIGMVILHIERCREFIFLGKDTHLVVTHPLLSLTPQLQSLRICAPNPHHCYKPVCWSWLSTSRTSLTTLEICLPYWQLKTGFAEFRDLISASPALRHLSLRGCLVEIPAETTPSVIEMPSLLSLSLSLTPMSYDSQPYLLECLFIPALEFLELRELDWTEWQSLQQTLVTKPSKFPMLRSLRLIDVDVDGVDVWLMDATPMLDHLTIIECDIAQVAMRSFLTLLDDQAQVATTTGCSPRWPLLRTLTLSHPDPTLLHSVVSARAGLTRPLSRLRLEHSYYSTMPLEWLQLQLLVEEFIVEDYFKSELPRHELGEIEGWKEPRSGKGY